MKVKLWSVPLLLCCAQVAWGQCSNGPCYTANPPKVTRLTPAHAVAQGHPAATVTGTPNLPGNYNNHNTTVTPGTQIIWDWTGLCPSGHQCSASTYYTINGGATHYYPSSQPFVGEASWTPDASYVGVTLNQFFVMNDDTVGETTQDRANVSVVAGNSPSIVYQDRLKENTILHFHASGGGGSMLNDFTMCQGADQQHCINATHTPQTWLTVSNLNTGFALSHPKHVSGNVAKSNESVSFSDDIFLSALPEDVFDYSEGDEVDCSVSGPVGVGPVQMDIRFERAITEEYISSILNSNGMHPEHIYCIIAATPPDFPGADEALPGTPSGQIVNVAFLYREWPKGTQEKGTPWNLVFPDIQEVGIGYYVKTTMEPDPVGCTMWDNGFRHLDLPTPLDPQPQ